MPPIEICFIKTTQLAQTSVAVLNITYTTEDGKNWNDTYIRNGTVNASNLACYMNRFHPDGCPEEVTQQNTAHAYGELALRTPCAHYNDISDIQNSRYDYGYYCRLTHGRQELAYRFNEYNPNDHQLVYPLFTNRIITASPGPCFIYSEVPTPREQALAGDAEYQVYTYTNGTITDTIKIPNEYTGLSGTTYIYRGTNLPQLATANACGPRCMWVWVYKSSGKGENPMFYQCPITIGLVSNVTRDSQNVTQEMARRAAVSIALKGQWTGTFSDQNWTQYQFYPYG